MANQKGLTMNPNLLGKKKGQNFLIILIFFSVQSTEVYGQNKQ